MAQPLGQRGEIARQESVESPTREARISHWIPDPLLELLKPPQVGAQVLLQKCCVHLVRPGEAVSVEAAQLLQIFPKKRSSTHPRLTAHLIQLTVEAMIAERCGRYRGQRRKLIYVLSGQPLELCIPTGRHHGQGCPYQKNSNRENTTSLHRILPSSSHRGIRHPCRICAMPVPSLEYRLPPRLLGRTIKKAQGAQNP